MSNSCAVCTERSHPTGIFDLDHSASLVAISYSTYLSDPRKFLWRCKDDPHLVVILNTHVDDDAAVLTCRGFWDETIFKLNKRYPGNFLSLSNLYYSRELIHDTVCLSLYRTLHLKSDNWMLHVHVGETCFCMNQLTSS